MKKSCNAEAKIKIFYETMKGNRMGPVDNVKQDDMTMKKTFDKEGTIKIVKAHSIKLSDALGAEQLRFKGNVTVSEIDLCKEDGVTVRKLRRIVEKRVCQDFWSTHRGELHSDAWGKSRMKREAARQLGRVCDGYAEYRFTA